MLWFIVIFLFMVAMAGCIPTKQHNRTVNKLIAQQDSIRGVGRTEGVTLFKASPDAAFYCELNYPARVIYDTTEVLKSDTIIVSDTTYLDGKVIIRENTKVTEQLKRTLEKESTAKLEAERRLAAKRLEEAEAAHAVKISGMERESAKVEYNNKEAIKKLEADKERAKKWADRWWWFLIAGLVGGIIVRQFVKIPFL
jgi:hypothetical protein